MFTFQNLFIFLCRTQHAFNLKVRCVLRRPAQPLSGHLRALRGHRGGQGRSLFEGGRDVQAADLFPHRRAGRLQRDFEEAEHE